MKSLESWRGDRRKFIKDAFRTGALGVSLLAVPSLGCGITSPGQRKDESVEDVVSQIKTFEADFGNKPLTFDEANSYIPLVAKLFSKSTNSRKSAEDLAQETYIVRGEPKEVTDVIEINVGPIENPFSSQSVQQFQKDYPSVEVTDGMAQVIAANSGNVGGLYWNGKTYLVIGDTPPPEVVGIEQQYTGKGPVVKCEEVVPIVETRSRLLHEYTHADNLVPFMPVEDEFFNAYFRRRQPDKISEKQAIINGVETRVLVSHLESDPNIEVAYFANGRKSNFIFHYTGHWPNENYTFEQTFDDINDYVTDYLSTRISVMNELPYTTAPYAHPDSYVNFETVLDQSKISYRELLNLYRNSQIVEFYTKIADGAQNIQFNTLNEKLRFGLQRINPGYHWPFWREPNYFKPYYPNVSTDDYKYLSPGLYESIYQGRADKPLLGCY